MFLSFQCRNQSATEFFFTRSHEFWADCFLELLTNKQTKKERKKENHRFNNTLLRLWKVTSNKTASCRSTSHYTQQNPQARTLISSERGILSASPSVQSNRGFHFMTTDIIKTTTADAVISARVWWQATSISFITEIGQEGARAAIFLWCGSAEYGACLQHERLHWHTARINMSLFYLVDEPGVKRWLAASRLDLMD